MAYQMAATVVTLNDLEGHSFLEGHSLVAGLFKCNPSNICAAIYTISTDSVLARFLCIRRASCQFPTSGRMSEIKSGAENSKCNHVTTLGFKGLRLLILRLLCRYACSMACIQDCRNTCKSVPSVNSWESCSARINDILTSIRKMGHYNHHQHNNIDWTRSNIIYLVISLVVT